MPLKSLSFIFIAFNCIYFRASLLGHCLFSIFHFRPFCGLLICRRVFARLFYLAIYFTHCHFPSGRFVFWWLLFLIFGHYERTAVRRSRLFFYPPYPVFWCWGVVVPVPLSVPGRQAGQNYGHTYKLSSDHSSCRINVAICWLLLGAADPNEDGPHQIAHQIARSATPLLVSSYAQQYATFFIRLAHPFEFMCRTFADRGSSGLRPQNEGCKFYCSVCDCMRVFRGDTNNSQFALAALVAPEQGPFIRRKWKWNWNWLWPASADHLRAYICAQLIIINVVVAGKHKPEFVESAEEARVGRLQASKIVYENLWLQY